MNSSPWILGPEPLAEHLRTGGAAIFPTDTLPALAALPEAAGHLWSLKARPAHKPLILMGASLEQLQENLGQPWHPLWLEQARAVWPGAVTLVLPLQGPIAAHLHPGGPSLGLRVPACDAARALLQRTGPLATTSTNRSGEPPAREPQEAADLFPDLPLLGPLPWPSSSGQASTVLAWRPEAEHGDALPWRVLRPGPTHPATAATPE